MEKENNLFITEISHLPYLYKKTIFIIVFKKAKSSKATYFRISENNSGIESQGVLGKHTRWNIEIDGFQGEINETPFSYYNFPFHILLSHILKGNRTRLWHTTIEITSGLKCSWIYKF